MHKSWKHARARFIAIAHVYNSCARISETEVHKIVINYQIKFHEDPSFCCGDICKTILVNFNRWFSMYFSYFPNYAPPKPSEIDNCWIIMNFFWDKISIDHHIKFHKDQSFRCGDICKTILFIFNRWFSMHFSYSRNYTPYKSSEMDNYLIIIDIFGN